MIQNMSKPRRASMESRRPEGAGEGVGPMIPFSSVNLRAIPPVYSPVGSAPGAATPQPGHVLRRDGQACPAEVRQPTRGGRPGGPAGRVVRNADVGLGPTPHEPIWKVCDETTPAHIIPPTPSPP